MPWYKHGNVESMVVLRTYTWMKISFIDILLGKSILIFLMFRSYSSWCGWWYLIASEDHVSHSKMKVLNLHSDQNARNDLWLIPVIAAFLQVIKFPAWRWDATINGFDATLGPLPTPVIVIGYMWDVCVLLDVKLSVKWYHVCETK